MPSASYMLGLAAWIAILASLFVFLLRRRRERRHVGYSLRSTEAGLALWFALLAMTLPEMWFAFLYDATDSFSQTNVSRLWMQRHVRANKAGFRDDRELPSVRESGVAYIGFTGDSFTFGHGIRNVADRFSDRVAKGLDAAFPRQTRVFNTALPGLDVRSLTNELAPEFVRLRTPLDVLVYVFVPNDIEYLDERTARFYQGQQSRSPRFFLWRDTYFYNWLYFRMQNVFAAGGEDYYGYLADAYTGEPWPEFTRKLDQLHAFCASQQIELRVVIFPFLTTLGDGDPFAAAYERVLEHCRDEGVPCLDLRPALTAHRGEGLMVSRFDAHPNERAHELAAGAILEDLTAALKTEIIAN